MTANGIVFRNGRWVMLCGAQVVDIIFLDKRGVEIDGGLETAVTAKADMRLAELHKGVSDG